jgi:PIN domain nuclease of toxin-antitoxin system
LGFRRQSSTSQKTQSIIINGENQIFVSIASLWEMAIKINLQKLRLQKSLSQIIQILPEMEILVLNLHPNHILQVEKLDNFHRDPFDRLIIAQAIVENYTIISSDEQFLNYPVKLLV